MLKVPVLVALIAAAGLAQGPAKRPQAAGIRWLVFVDDLHLNFSETAVIRERLDVILNELVQDGDQVAMRSSGPSGVAVELTSDASAAAAAVTKVFGNGLRPGDMVADARNGPLEVNYRAAVALTSATGMLSGSQLPDRRTAMVYISNGYGAELFPDTGAPTTGRRRVSVDQVRQQQSDLTKFAAGSGIRIFPIEIRNVGDVPEGLTPDEWTTYLAGTRASLSQLAEATGGATLFDVRDLQASVRNIRTEMLR